MSDLIGYAVAWKSSEGAVKLSGETRPRHEAEIMLAAKRLEYPTIKHFLIEIYPDSNAVSVSPQAEMREEVTQ